MTPKHKKKFSDMIKDNKNKDLSNHTFRVIGRGYYEEYTYKQVTR